MTERLYYLDSQLRDFEASVIERADQGKRIYLDRTAFYPTSGGQPHDTGLLEGVSITEVVDEGDRVAHLLSNPLPVTNRVRGELNWDRRLDHMQQHTGQHLLSAVLADLWGYTTTSVHLGAGSSTIELDATQLGPEQVAQTEERANQIVTENRRVDVSFEEATTASGLRKPPTRSGTIRIITIENLDRSACGGTHVAGTGEIGAILLRKVERVRKGIRLEFLCGLRAVRRSRLESDILTQLTGQLSSSVDELPRVLEHQRAELKEATSSRREQEAQLSAYRARELYAEAMLDATGVRRTLVRLRAGTADELRGLAQAYASLPKAVFIGAIESPPAVLLSASADAEIDAGSVLKSMLALAGGRGGGSRTLAQGVLPGQAQLEQVIASLAAIQKGPTLG